MSILIVEDQLDIANLIRINIEMLGQSVTLCHTYKHAKQHLATAPFSLLVLDLGLPDGDGLSLCQELRVQKSTLPILMLTARTSELERVEGLEIGADDYLTKPFSILELQARVKALLRRSALQTQSAVQDERLEFDGLVIDIRRREVMRRVEKEMRLLELTSTEFDLLVFLARHAGKVFNREQLLREVWGYHHEGYEHTVNSHINRLRSKLESDPANPRYVRTVWGVGYKFAGEA
jgi:two-component system, OmpR family, alkaline phosphatase synthesis response regulator PhoP